MVRMIAIAMRHTKSHPLESPIKYESIEIGGYDYSTTAPLGTATLSPTIIAGAQARGRSLDLWTTAMRLLAQLAAT